MRGGADGRRGRRVTAALALLSCCSVLLGGCGLLGRPQPQSADAPPMEISSPEFIDHVIPARFTCYGARETAPLFWSAPPRGTKSLAVVIDDSDTPISPRVYWLVFDISPETTDLQVNALPPHARVAYNSAHQAGYDAPCPVGAPHNYRFTVYALNSYLGTSLPGTPQLLQAWMAIAGHVIDMGTMTDTAFPPARS